MKALLIDLPIKEVSSKPSNIEISTCSIGSEPTLHDYHAIIMDVDEIYRGTNLSYAEKDSIGKSIRNLKAKVQEQIQTGGIFICFSGATQVFTGYSNERFTNYDWCPFNLGVTSFSGDTVHPKMEELNYYTPLVKSIHDKSMSWTCYFREDFIPKDSKILATNRAGYPIFVEIPIGSGKLVMLPRFKNRSQAVTTIVNEILPQLIREDESVSLPQWLSEFVPTIEKSTRDLLKEIDTAKRLLYTKDRTLKKAVARALETIGFTVKMLPDGTLPDLAISTDGMNGVVEVKGHDKVLADRKDVLQLLGYLSETDLNVKGVFVCNHQFQSPPNLRGDQAYTEGAAQLARANGICLTSSVELWKVVLAILEGKTTQEDLVRIRQEIITGTGSVTLDHFDA